MAKSRIYFSFTLLNYTVLNTKSFKKQFARLSKKYSSLFNDIDDFKESIAKNPFQGESLGHGLYKVRMSITSKGQGKSGGARVITFVRIVDETVSLFAIYDKSEIENIPTHELINLIKRMEYE